MYCILCTALKFGAFDLDPGHVMSSANVWQNFLKTKQKRSYVSKLRIINSHPTLLLRNLRKISHLQAYSLEIRCFPLKSRTHYIIQIQRLEKFLRKKKILPKSTHSGWDWFIMHVKLGHSMDNGFIFKKINKN